MSRSNGNVLIKNGKVVNVDGIIEQDIYAENGIIKAIGKDLRPQGECTVIDANGLYVLPGGIDPHTHFEMEFMGTKTIDDFYYGTRAAVAGGTTMIIDFVFPPQGESILEKYKQYRKTADAKVCCDYGLHIAVTGMTDTTLKEMEILCKEHGINSFKMFMAYTFMLNDAELYTVFEKCKELGALPMVHAENGSIIMKNTDKLLAKGVTAPEGHTLSRTEEVESEAVNRACVIAKQVDCPLYVVHMMSDEAAKAIKFARKTSKYPLVGETLAAAIGRDGRELQHTCFQHAAGHLVSPPLRMNPLTPWYIMDALAKDILQLVGSDNCTFSKEQKELGLRNFSKIPNGVNGVEDRMSVVWERAVHSGFIDPCRFVEITSTNAAKMFNIYPRKGVIAVGSDADIVVWNPNKTRKISAKTHHQAVDFNIFEGMECHGVPDYVIVNGRVRFQHGKLEAVKGEGRFVATPVHTPYFYK